MDTGQQQGFTLIELMVVLVIIGIASAAVSLSIRSDPTRLMRQDIERLAQVLEAAQSEVHVDGRPILLRADSEGYRFFRQGGENFADDPLLRPRQWQNQPLQVRVEPNKDLLIDAEWIGEPIRILLSDGQHQVELSRSPSGKVTLQ